MKEKKWLSNLIWVAALVFLAWYFLWPVSIALPDGNLSISVMERDATGQTTQTVYRVPAGSSGAAALNQYLDAQRCFHTIASSNKNTDQSFWWEQQFLIQAENGTAIYTYGGSRLTYNDTILRVKDPEILHQQILDLLRDPDTHGITSEGTEPVTAESALY